ncbi:Uncharacterised protein [Klebsiella pneumoniae]|nr:Uncharacterised protein [Klebsiella pneumoniae]
MPSTPFMGVRISWLILARNSALVCNSAVCAASLVRCCRLSCWISRWRSVSETLRTSPARVAKLNTPSTSQPGSSCLVPNSTGRNTMKPALNTIIPATIRRAGW